MFLFFLLDPPGPPSCPEVKDKTKSSISLAWKPPAKDGGSPIKGYIVEMQEEGTTDWKRVNEPDKLLTSCECVVPNLKELKKYRFRVKAVNEAGESEPSDATGEIPATDIQGTSPHFIYVFIFSFFLFFFLFSLFFSFMYSSFDLMKLINLLKICQLLF